MKAYKGIHFTQDNVTIINSKSKDEMYSRPLDQITLSSKQRLQDITFLPNTETHVHLTLKLMGVWAVTRWSRR